jgi:hypothetical protein
MLELLILGFVFFVGYQIGMMVLSWKLRDIILKEAIKQGINTDTMQPVKVATIEKLIVEKEDDTLFLYDFDTMAFICQAKTLNELASLSKAYKNIKYAAVIHGDECFMFIDGNVKVSNES